MKSKLHLKLSLPPYSICVACLCLHFLLLGWGKVFLTKTIIRAVFLEEAFFLSDPSCQRFCLACLVWESEVPPVVMRRWGMTAFPFLYMCHFCPLLSIVISYPLAASAVLAGGIVRCVYLNCHHNQDSPQSASLNWFLTSTGSFSSKSDTLQASYSQTKSLSIIWIVTFQVRNRFALSVIHIIFNEYLYGYLFVYLFLILPNDFYKAVFPFFSLHCGLIAQ